MFKLTDGDDGGLRTTIKFFETKSHSQIYFFDSKFYLLFESKYCSFLHYCCCYYSSWLMLKCEITASSRTDDVEIDWDYYLRNSHYYFECSDYLSMLNLIHLNFSMNCCLNFSHLASSHCFFSVDCDTLCPK